MALTSGTKQNIATVRADVVGDVQWALVVFTMAGVYDQSANSSLVGVGALISGDRRNGKTVTLRGAMLAQNATKQSGNTIMSLKTVAVSTDDVTFEITDGDYSTELAAAAIPAQNTPFGILVAFTEA